MRFAGLRARPALRHELATAERPRARSILDAVIVSFAVNAASFGVGALTW
jgi:hypothetical protein